MTKTALLVEDGSVFIDDICKQFPDVPIIVYRQGSPKPEFINIDMDAETLNSKKNNLYTIDQVMDCIRKAATRLPFVYKYDSGMDRRIKCVSFDDIESGFFDVVEQELKVGFDLSGSNE